MLHGLVLRSAELSTKTCRESLIYVKQAVIDTLQKTSVPQDTGGFQRD